MRRLLVFCLPMLCANDVRAQDDHFEKRVQPILKEHCLRCHGPDKQRGGFDVRSAGSILKGAQTGKVLTPGQPGRSLILQLVAPGGDPHMPPSGQLTKDQIADLTKWIEQLKPDAVAAPKGHDHWAFQKMRPVSIPEVDKKTWIRTPIDAFILAQLEKQKLSPSPQATRSELVRRVTYDLIGLPPTPEEVRDACVDSSPDWFARVVDRLLASPHYGERWARHWLDLARYADSSGFHNDIDRPNAWRYRDYVIASFNADKPYSQFVREQLAGDEIDPTNPAVLAATGFCIAGPSNDDNMGQVLEKYRLEQLDDVLSTTGNVFLGLTLGCARCHDHKYDPLPQEDYYRLLAIFNNTERREVPLVAGKIELTAAKKLTKTPLKSDAITFLTDTSAKPRTTNLLWRGNHEQRGPEVQPGVPAALGEAVFPVPASGATTGFRTRLADWIAAPDNPLTYRVLANRLWQHHFGRGIVATPSNFGVSGERPTHPDLLDWLALEIIRHEGRLKPIHRMLVLSATYQQASHTSAHLAQVDPQNLWLARMNKRRLEAEAIRDGILAVSGKLNREGGGPGIKPRMHPDLLAASKRNQWPNVPKEGPQHWKRSIYVYIKRQLLLMMLQLFDAPTSNQSCGRREESTVPTQALILMNDDFVSDQAGYLADRILAEAKADPAARVEQAFQLALSRSPSAARIEQATAFLAQREQAYRKDGKLQAESARLALTDLCHVLFNSNEFLYVD
jgi:cytochrome c553